MTIRPKQFARMGEFYLEEAILDVLLEARHEEECLGAAEIGKRTGIFRKPEAGLNDAITWGMLNKLLKNGKVEKCAQKRGSGKEDGWQLTNEEYQSRRDDVR